MQGAGVAPQVLLLSYSAPEFVGPVPGDTEAALRAAFARARRTAALHGAAVLFIDEIETLCPARSEEGEDSARVVAQLLTLMDGVKRLPAAAAAHSASDFAWGRVIVVGATNHINIIDPALRRPGRFDREVSVPVPAAAERASILQRYLGSVELADGIRLRRVADVAVGFVGADLEALAREACMASMRRQVGVLDLSALVPADSPGELPDAVIEDVRLGEGGIGNSNSSRSNSSSSSGSRVAPVVTLADFTEAFRRVNGSSSLRAEKFRAGVTVDPAQLSLTVAESLQQKTTGDDDEGEGKRGEAGGRQEGLLDSRVGGMDRVKQELIEGVMWPLKYGRQMQQLGLSTSTGFLLYGPPGCGKTSIAREVARLSGVSFLTLSAAEVYNAELGEAERTVRNLFTRARANLPCVIFMDEIDSIVSNRDEGGGGSGSGGGDSMQSRILATLLTEMDGFAVRDRLTIMAATNQPDTLDPALLRPGRFDKLLYVPLPDESARAAILRVHTRQMPLTADCRSQGLRELAARTEGYSGAELENLCREAAMITLRAALPPDGKLVDGDGEAVKLSAAAVNSSSPSSQSAQPAQSAPPKALTLPLEHFFAAMAVVTPALEREHTERQYRDALGQRGAGQQ